MTFESSHFVFDSLSAAGRQMGARTSQNCRRTRIFPSCHCCCPKTKSRPNCPCCWNRRIRSVRRPNNVALVASSHCVPEAAELLCASRKERKERAATKRWLDLEFYSARFRCVCLKRRLFVRFRSGIPPLSQWMLPNYSCRCSQSGVPADRSQSKNHCREKRTGRWSLLRQSFAKRASVVSWRPSRRSALRAARTSTYPIFVRTRRP
jgi:hypothetical protein